MATIAKRFPMMASEDMVTIDQLLEACANVEKPLKVHENIIENVERVETNYKMMQLYSPIISAQGKQKINYAFDNYEFDFNKTEIRKMMIQDGFGHGNWDSLFQALNKISVANA